MSIAFLPYAAAARTLSIMSPRLEHALRFAVPTFFAVLLAGAVWEVVEVGVQGDVPVGMSRTQAMTMNLQAWAIIAAVETVVVFLLRVSDVVVRPPSWGFAWVLAFWLGLATAAAAHATERGRTGLALAVAGVAVAVWMLLHRRLPGWPGHGGPVLAVDEATSERDLR